MNKGKDVNMENNTSDIKTYPAIISSLRSPLSMFGLAMLICNAVFSLSAGLMGNLNAFIYAIHTFLGIVFAFIMIAIWSPRSLYHPSELEDVSGEIPEIKHSRVILTMVFLVVIFFYGAYQVYKLNLESKTQEKIEEIMSYHYCPVKKLTKEKEELEPR